MWARFCVAYTYSRIARDFPTQEALREYLKEHPDADKSLHHVKKKDEEPAKPRDPREYARERAKFAPPKKKEPFVGMPSFHAASELVRRIVARFIEAHGQGSLGDLSDPVAVTKALLRAESEKAWVRQKAIVNAVAQRLRSRGADITEELRRLQSAVDRGARKTELYEAVNDLFRAA